MGTVLVTELEVVDKLKILTWLMNQMLTFASIRDEIDVRQDNMIEAQKELRDSIMQENKRIRDQQAEDKTEKEKKKSDEEKKEKEKLRREELRRSEFLDREKEIQKSIRVFQDKASMNCLGLDRAFRRYWMFESLPGIYIEHEIDDITPCQDTPTPWNPEAAPPTEEEALERARQIMKETSNSENSEEITKALVKKPVMKQQTINFA